MRLEYYNSDRLKKELIEMIGRHLDLQQYSVFFFGSRVTGKGDSRSDIDVGIEGLLPIPIGIMGAIKDELEEFPLLYKIDVVDFKNVSEKFYDFAKKHVEYIHEIPMRV